jgi:hypothetical protein
MQAWRALPTVIALTVIVLTSQPVLIPNGTAG